jgi:hypothetical protein
MTKDELQAELEGYGIARILPSQVTVEVLRVQVGEQRESRGIASSSTRGSIGCLRNSLKNCLVLPSTEENITRYLSLIAARSLKPGWSHPKIFLFGTAFYWYIQYPEHIQEGFADGFGTSFDEDLLSYDLLLIPVLMNNSGHIGVAVVDVSEQSISYYDSDLCVMSSSEVDSRLLLIR